MESSNIRVTDIYVQNEHHIWFAYKESTIFSPLPIRGVLLLDDRGTPTNLADDIWTDYPVSKDGTGGSIVIDAQGRTWFGNSMGLFRYDGSQWQSLSQCAIGDLAATMRQPVVTVHPRQSLQWQQMILLCNSPLKN